MGKNFYIPILAHILAFRRQGGRDYWFQPLSRALR